MECVKIDNPVQKLYIDEEVMETNDIIEIFKEFNRLFNERLLKYVDFGYVIKNIVNIQLINGKVEAGYWEVKGEELIMLQSGSIVMNLSRSLAYFLGLDGRIDLVTPLNEKPNPEREESDSENETLNLGIKKVHNFELHDNIFPGQYMTLYLYKKKTNNQSVKDTKVKSPLRIRDGMQHFTKQLSRRA